MSNFGKLKLVNLREGWPHEALDFTSWLATTENLKLLGNEIDIDLELIETEYSIGSFRLDMLCQIQETKDNVIIENQLEMSNHDHLGKLITYASGIGSKYIIWILRDIKDEHRSAVTWLNDHMNGIYFFVIKIELWQIDDSAYAPKFHILVEPDDWKREIKEQVRVSTLSPLKKLQFQFWSELRAYGEEKYPDIRYRKPIADNYYEFTSGLPNIRIVLKWFKSDNQENLGCELWIPNDKEYYQQLHKYKDEIADEIDFNLDWQELPEKIGSRIITVANRELDNRDRWDEYFEWFLTKYLQFKSLFLKYHNKIKE